MKCFKMFQLKKAYVLVLITPIFATPITEKLFTNLSLQSWFLCCCATQGAPSIEKVDVSSVYAGEDDQKYVNELKTDLTGNTIGSIDLGTASSNDPYLQESSGEEMSDLSSKVQDSNVLRRARKKKPQGEIPAISEE